jgi:hypothetical protein
LIKNSVSIDHVLNNIHFVYPSNHVRQSFISINILFRNFFKKSTNHYLELKENPSIFSF